MSRKSRKLLALTLALVMATGNGTFVDRDTDKVRATAKDLVQEQEVTNVYKVTMDDTGYITADSGASLENQKFSWDNATVYFVLTDRFLNGDTSNDHSYGRGMQADGKTPVAGLDTSSNPGTFHGGDLKGITSKVEEGYFNDLGVNAIWITAPYEQIHGYTSGNVQSNNCNTYPDSAGGGFPYYSYHGYWTLDYTNIDENMGDEKDFENFVDACHERGIRVVMDVVMNHVGYTTMQDAVDYGFDGVLKDSEMATWKEYYYGNAKSLMGGDPEALNFWDSTSQIWASKWWGAGFVRASYPGYDAAGGDDYHMSLCGLPDVITEAAAPTVDTPPLLVTKWTKEGRLAEEQGELDDYFSRTGNKKQARYYLVKWLTDWVREYGVDGFRCDTAKHVDLDAWKDLKTEAVSALQEWRKNNPDKPGAGWTDDFWMTGEAWGHGMGRSPYYDNGFDSMINFTFPKDGSLTSLEGTYSSYAEAINSDETFNSLSYVASHDDSAGVGVFTADASKSKNLGTSLLLTPGGAQIYYGNELNRQIQWEDFFTGSDYLDQRYRSFMNWDNYDKDVLAHWQKVGQFRNKHLSVGAGQHEMLSEAPYTFSRTYHLEEEDEDKVVVSLPGKAGACTVNVGDVFEDGETITDYYTGEKYEVSGGSVNVTAGENGVVLLEGSGIVKASVSAKTKNKTTTYSSETFEITLRANKAKDTYYQVNGGEKKAFVANDVITIGGDTAYEEETVITVTGISEDDGSELKKEYTYTRGKEPTVSDGEFTLKVKKSDFATAPTVFAYSNDAAETAFSGKWPGDTMVEDDDSAYWVYKNEKITEEARVIIVSGSWRSTAEMQPGLIVKGCMLYDKTAGDLTEMPSGEPGKVTIKYVDQQGKELKSIYRVGVVGKKYTTYAADIDGYTLVETPKNATGTYETESEVVYVYAKGNEPAASKQPTESKKPTETVKPTVTPTDDVDDKKETVKPSESIKPSDLEIPQKSTVPQESKKPAETIKPTTTVKPEETPEAGGDLNIGGIISPIEEGVLMLFTNANKYYVGNNIKIDAVFVGVETVAYYDFVVKDSAGNIVKEEKNTEKSQITWKPAKKGNYEIIVTAKDADKQQLLKKKKSVKVTNQGLTLNSLKAKKVSGTKVKITASKEGGIGTVKYKFSVKAPSGKKKVVQKYSTKKTVTITAKKKGNYTIYLQMKDNDGTVVTKTIKYKHK